MSTSKPRIIIVGGNFAGLVAASRLSRCYDVKVIDPTEEFEWTPNIHEIISGVKTRDSVTLSRHACVTRYGHEFINDAVTHIDHVADTVVLENGDLLPFDACIVAAGSQRTQFGISGAGEYSTPLRTADDAVHISAVLDDLARHETRASVVIVGGGVSGIEAVGEILRLGALDEKFDVHVIEQSARLLPQLPESLARDAASQCARHDVRIHTNTGVKQVGRHSVTLSDGQKLRADLCIWSAGMTLPDFLRENKLRDGSSDWLPVDDTLQSTVAPNVFVAGDCALLPDPVRKQAYYAMDMGRLAGDNVRRFFDDRPLKSFRPSPTPMLIAFGDITTWLVAGEHVVASPLLAAAKEGVYQATMARLASPHQPLQYASGISGRATLAAQQLLLPQLGVRNVLRNLTSSRVLT